MQKLTRAGLRGHTRGINLCPSALDTSVIPHEETFSPHLGQNETTRHPKHVLLNTITKKPESREFRLFPSPNAE